MKAVTKEVLIQSGKFLGLFGMAYCAGMPQLAGVVGTALGIGQKPIESLLGMVGNMISGFSGEAFKDISKEMRLNVNHDLQRELEEAYTATLLQMESNILDVDGLDTDNIFNLILAPDYYKKIRADRKILRQKLFDPLLTELKNEVEIGRMLDNNGQLEPATYLAELISRHVEDIPFLQAESQEAFIAELCTDFKAIFPNYFLKGLKKNEQARTAYFKHLMEGILVQGRQTDEQLQTIHALLTQTGQSVEQMAREVRSLNPQLTAINQALEDFEFSNRVYHEANLQAIQEIRLEVEANRAPSLNIDLRPHESLDDPNLYHYRYQFTKLVGREAERSQLHDLVFAPKVNNKRFAWCLLTGEGGSGKSRLAQELSLEASEAGYHAGFFSFSNISALPDWTKWNPAAPVLIVIDYAFSNTKLTLELIHLLDRFNAGDRLSGPPLRLILLERTVNTNWEKTIQGIPAVNSTQYPSIALLPLDPDSQWQIIAEVIGKLNPARLPELEKEKISWLDKLNEIDAKHRPLFTFLSAVALSSDSDIRNWNKHQLLSHVNSRMITYWGKYQGYARHPQLMNHLLAITTLCRYVSLAEADDICYDLDPQVPFSELEEAYLAFTESYWGDRSQMTYQQGIQPDILGEYFLLDLLGGILNGSARGTHLAEKLVLKAWSLLPEQTFWTLWLTFEDYHKLRTDDVAEPVLKDQFSRVLDFLTGTQWVEKADDKMAPYLATLFGNMVYHHCLKKEYDSVQLLLEHLLAMTDRFPALAAVTKQYILGLRSYIHDNTTQNAAIELQLQQVRAIVSSEAFEKDVELTGEYLEALMVYIYYTEGIDTEYALSQLEWVWSLRSNPLYASDIGFTDRVMRFTGTYLSTKRAADADADVQMDRVKQLLDTAQSEAKTTLLLGYSYCLNEWLKLPGKPLAEYQAKIDAVIKLVTPQDTPAPKLLSLLCYMMHHTALNMPVSEPAQTPKYLDVMLHWFNDPTIRYGSEVPFFYAYMLEQYIESSAHHDFALCLKYFDRLDEILHDKEIKDKHICGIWLSIIYMLLSKIDSAQPEHQQFCDRLENGIQADMFLYHESSTNYLALFLKAQLHLPEQIPPNDVAVYQKVITRLYNTYQTERTLGSMVALYRLLGVNYPEQAEYYQQEAENKIRLYNESHGTAFTRDKLLIINSD